MSLGLSLSLYLGSLFGGDADMALINMYYGDGSDGDVTVSGALSLSRDMYYRNLTLAAGAAITVNGFRIFVSELLDASAAPTGAIAGAVYDGGDASGVNAGAANASVPGNRPLEPARSSAVGKAGGTTTGTGGTATGNAGFINCGGPCGTTGGTGGTGSSGAGGAVGTFTTGNVIQFRYPMMATIPGGTTVKGGCDAPSGGSGGGDTTAGGGSGAGGAGGAIVAIYAKRILRSSSNANAGIIQAKGGKGGAGGIPAAGNRGGGGGAPGAGGGNVYIQTSSLEGSTHTNAIDVSGGAGGNGGTKTGTGTDGQGAQAGFGGVVQIINTGASTITIGDKRAVGGNAASGTTGGTSTAAQVDL